MPPGHKQSADWCSLIISQSRAVKTRVIFCIAGCTRSQIESQAAGIATSSYQPMLQTIRRGRIVSASPFCCEVAHSPGEAEMPERDTASQSARDASSHRSQIPVARVDEAGRQLVGQPEAWNPEGGNGTGEDGNKQSQDGSKHEEDKSSHNGMPQHAPPVSPFSHLPGPQPPGSIGNPLVQSARDLMRQSGQVRDGI